MVIITAIDDTTDRNIVEEGRALADAFGEELHVFQVHDRGEIEDAAGTEETMLEDERTPISKALFGSVTQAVLLSPTCPAS